MLRALVKSVTYESMLPPCPAARASHLLAENAFFHALQSAEVAFSEGRLHLGKDNLFACLCARFALPLLCCEPWSSRSQTAVQAECRDKACFGYAEAQPALAAEQQPVQAESRGKARFDYAEAQPALAAEQQLSMLPPCPAARRLASSR